MKISATQVIRAPREQVFSALQDPAILQRCIDGCQRLVRAADGSFDVELKLGVGMIKGAYKGKVELRDLKRPESFTLTIDGKGLTGIIKSKAVVRLSENNGATTLVSEGEAVLGGLIASVGSRLLDGLSKKMTAEFFEKLAKAIESP